MRVIPSLFTLCIGALALTNLVGGCSSADSTAVDRPKADYDAATGRLRRLTFDANQNGHNDAVSVMDGTRIDHIELDTDENGAVDRWEYYGAGRRLVKVGVSRQNDGIIDAFEFYGQGDGNDDIITRIDVSTRRDNRFDRVEFYTGGVLARVEEDADGDGRVDKWELYRPVANRSPGEPPSSVTSVAFDEAHRGTATRRLVFADDGTVQRVEIDPDGDGIFVAQPSGTGAR
jgi:hypothetical protein